MLTYLVIEKAARQDEIIAYNDLIREFQIFMLPSLSWASSSMLTRHHIRINLKASRKI